MQTGSRQKIALILVDRLVGGSERRYFSIIGDLIGELESRECSLELIINDQLKDYIRDYHEFEDVLARVEIRVVRSYFSPPSLDSAQAARFGVFLGKMRFAAKLLRFMFNYAAINVQLLLLVIRNGYSLVHLVGYQGVLCSVIPMPAHRVYSFVGYDVRCLEGRVRPRFYFPWLINLAIRRARFAEVNTEELYDTLIRVPSVENDKARLNRSFVEADLFEIMPKKDIVVFAARFEEYKQPLLMLSSIPKVVAAFPDRDIDFFVAGEGYMEGAMKEMIDELGISHCVHLGHCSNMPELLGQSKIFLSIQKDENYGSRSLFEAMSCGNAIVATDVGYSSVLVKPETGILVSSDANEIANAVIRILANDQMRQRMGENARRVVEQGYRKRSFVENTIDMYLQVLGRNA